LEIDDRCRIISPAQCFSKEEARGSRWIRRLSLEPVATVTLRAGVDGLVLDAGARDGLGGQGRSGDGASLRLGGSRGGNSAGLGDNLGRGSDSAGLGLVDGRPRGGDGAGLGDVDRGEGLRLVLGAGGRDGGGLVSRGSGDGLGAGLGAGPPVRDRDGLGLEAGARLGLVLGARLGAGLVLGARLGGGRVLSAGLGDRLGGRAVVLSGSVSVPGEGEGLRGEEDGGDSEGIHHFDCFLFRLRKVPLGCFEERM